jgi:outer membrane protein/protease secretion system outer membrane protein
MVCRKFKHVALVIVISSAFVQSHAMDLMQVYLAAQSQDASLLATRAAAAAGRERIPQAKSQLYPNISANAIRNNNRLTNSGANLLGQEQTTNSQYRSGSESVTLRQPIYRSAALAQYFQAQAQVEDSESMLMQEEQNLAVRVGSAYFEALLTDEQLALVLAQRVSYITQLDSARKSFQAGFGTRTDIDEAQARLDMTYAQEIEARQNVDFTLRQLQAMLTQPIDKLVPLDVSRLQILPPEPADLETWLDKVYRNSPQLKSLQAQVEVAHQEVEKNKAGHLPTLDAIWQWTRSESDTVRTRSRSEFLCQWLDNGRPMDYTRDEWTLVCAI